MNAKNKPLFEMKRVKLYEKLPIDTPMSVIIDPSSLCNLKCIYCAQALGSEFEKRHFKRQIMEYSTFEKIVDQLDKFPSKIKKVHLFRSGEPFLNPRISDMVKLLKERSICESLNISTNAVLLSKKLSIDLINAGLDCLTISLQGMSSKKFKEIANVDIDFEDFVENIRFFYKNRGKCKLYIKNIDVALEDGDEESFYKIFGEISDRVFVETACPVYPSIDYSNIIKQDRVTRYGELVKEPEVCQISFYHLHILSNGDVIPCSSIDSPLPLWNIDNMELVDIWNSKERIDFLKLQASKNRRTNEICSRCHRLSQELRPEDALDEYSSYILEGLNGGRDD